MRTVKIQGGLGNQLFGLAFARSLAILAGGPVGVDISSYRADRYGKAFLLQELARRIGGLGEARRPVMGHRLTSLVLRNLPFALPGYVPEPNIAGVAGMDAILRDLAGRSGYFDGYWQDETYIHQPAPLIAQIRDFVARQSPGMSPATGARVDVALHFRTYKEENHPRRSRTPGRDYFTGAIARIEAVSGPVGRIHLISDDPDLALRRLGDIGREIVPAARGNAWRDLSLLLNARSLILTNSSFSWWGGYCGRADTIIYPERRGLFHYPVPARRFLLA